MRAPAILHLSAGGRHPTRARRFSTEDAAAIENLLVSLVYPLRNALAHQRSLESALKDALTGLYNRAPMTNAQHREIRLARRHKAPLSLLMLDIDRFKHINDSYGHAAGDTALKVLAECIANCIRNTDVLARFGGEEFAVLLNSTERAARCCWPSASAPRPAPCGSATTAPRSV